MVHFLVHEYVFSLSCASKYAVLPGSQDCHAVCRQLTCMLSCRLEQLVTFALIVFQTSVCSYLAGVWQGKIGSDGPRDVTMLFRAPLEIVTAIKCRRARIWPSHLDLNLLSYLLVLAKPRDACCVFFGTQLDAVKI